MENQAFQKTPFARLLIGAVLGLGTSIAPLVLLGFGLAQFNIIRLVGVQNATAVYGMVGGIAGIAIVIMSPLGGVIADKTRVKFGRRRFWMVAGSIGGALSMLTFTYAPSVPVLIIGYCLVNFFYGLVTLSCYAVVPEQVDPEKFGRVSGLFGAAAPVCVMVGSAVLGVYANVPVQQKLLAITIIQVIGGVMAALLIKDKQYAGNKESESKKGFSEGFKNFYPSVRKYPEYTWALFTKLFINVTNAGKDIAIMNTTVNLSSAIVTFLAPILIALGTKLFGGDGYTFFFLVLASFSVLSALVVIPIPEMSTSADKRIKDENMA